MATKIMTASEVAKTLKIEPKRLRSILRSQADKANGGKRYEFRDSEVPKLRERVEEYSQREETAKAAKKAKKQ